MTSRRERTTADAGLTPRQRRTLAAVQDFCRQNTRRRPDDPPLPWPMLDGGEGASETSDREALQRSPKRAHF